MDKSELENKILQLFQVKGHEKASAEVMKLKTLNAPKERVTMIRNILSRLHVKADGTYFLKQPL